MRQSVSSGPRAEHWLRSSDFNNMTPIDWGVPHSTFGLALLPGQAPVGMEISAGQAFSPWSEWTLEGLGGGYTPGGIGDNPAQTTSSTDAEAGGLIHVDLLHEVDIGVSHAKGGGKGKPDTGSGGGKGGGGGKKGGPAAPDPDDADTSSGSGGSTNDSGGTSGSGTTTGTGGSYARTFTSGSADGSGFNITLEFQGTWSDSLFNIFVEAAEKFSDLIVGDLPGVNMGGRIIDDILITAQLMTIDGTGGILGQAGPTSIRADSYLPAMGVMNFDSADALNYEAKGLFDEIVFHEMAHALGFGSLWNYFGLVSGGSTYTGKHANAEYHAAGGTAAGIPVETDYGAGTAGAHWDEATFQGELMTGIINGSNYFSAMSAASFADLGYTLADYTQLGWVDSSQSFA